MTEKRQGPTPGVRLMEVSVNRELYILQYNKNYNNNNLYQGGRDKRGVLFIAEPPLFGGGGISFVLFPQASYCSQVWVLIHRNWSIINAIRYDYNDHEGDINRKTTIMIITK